MRLWPLPDRRRDPAGPTTRSSPAGGNPDGSGRVFDEALLGQLRRLTLHSRGAVAQGLAGEHRSRRRGASPEFADFKNYTQGDDFRQIDWSTYARLDELFVRLSEVTTEFNVHILLDASESMAWSGLPSLPTKFTYARRVAGALGYIGLWHFDRLTVTPFGGATFPRFGPVQGRSHAAGMVRYLESMTTRGGTDLARTLAEYGRARRQPGIMFVVSDLLSGEPRETGAVLRDLRARGWNVTVFHIVDPVELDPAAAMSPDGGLGTIELIDLEDAGRLRLSPTGEVIERYRSAYDAWLEETERVCADEALDYVRLRTDWEFEAVVLRLLHGREVIAS